MGINPKKAALVVLFLASLFLCLSGLGRVSFWNNNEPRYAHTARNMLITGDWVNPTYRGRLRADKPPLTYWLIAASAKVLNHGEVDEFTARLPFALLGVIGVWLTFLLGRLLFGDWGGIASAFFLLFTLEYLLTARRCLPDMALCVSVLATIHLLHLGYATGRRVLFYTFASVPAALGFLTKGPIAVVIPFGTIFTFLLAKGELRSQRVVDLLPGAVLFSLLTLPWFLVVEKGFASEFFLVHNLQRFAKGFDHHKPWFFYLQALPWNFAPASHFLPLGIRLWWQEKRTSNLLLPLCWALFTLTLLSLAASKRVVYLLPLSPALALVAGGSVARVLTEKANEKTIPWFKAGAVATLIGMGIAPLLPPFYRLPPPPWFYLCSLLPLGILAIQRRIPLNRQPLLAGVLLMAAYSSYFLHFQPQYDRLHRSARPLAQRVIQEVKGNTLYKTDFFDAALEYYLGRERIPQIKERKPLQRVSATNSPIFLLAREKDWRWEEPQLASHFKVVMRAKSRGKVFLLLKQVVPFEPSPSHMAFKGNSFPKRSHEEASSRKIAPLATRRG